MSLLAAEPDLPGTPDDYLVQVWDTGSGLPDNMVNSISQTPDGYLWIGTQHGGLARFDGSRFVNFDPSNTPQLTSIEIQKLLVDGSGTLWIGIVEGGIISYRDGRFHFEYRNENTPRSWIAGIMAEQTNRIDFFSEGGLIFRRTQAGTTNQWETFDPKNILSPWSAVISEDANGLVWYKQIDGRLAQMRGTNFVTLTSTPGLASPVVNAVAKDVSGRIWIAAKDRLAFWDGKAFVNMTPTNGPLDSPVQNMVPSPDGGFWVQTQHHLRKYVGRQWKVMINTVTNGVNTEWEVDTTNEEFSILFADHLRGVWFWSKHTGLGYVNRNGLVSWVRDAEGKLNGGVRCYFEDHEGNVWLGLKAGGLALVRPRLFHSIWPKENADDQKGASVCEDQRGVMWFGTSGGQVLQWQNDAFTIFNRLPADETKVLPAGDGGVWVGSFGISCLTELNDGRFTRPFPGRDIGAAVRCLYRDRRGALWIGSEFGLFRWETNALKTFGTADGFTPAYVLAITEDRTGDIWLGTALGELRHLHAGKFETFLPPDSLTDKSVLQAATHANPLENIKRGALSGGERFCALLFDSDGVLWIGSLGGGLLRFKDAQFKRFTTRAGLPSDYISQLLEDDRHELWLGTRSGIVRVTENELDEYADEGGSLPSFIAYDKNDGLPALECSTGSQPACWEAHDGRLWFTTLRGAVWVDPALVHINFLPPPVHIEDVLVDGESITEKKGAVLSLAGRLPEKVRIAAGRHYFEFKFCALSFVSPGNVKFKWRLEGLDENWVNGENLRSASYGYIPPGNYRFEVMACNNDGFWNEIPAAVLVTILPYFWQTWWFIGAAGLLVAGGIAGGARYVVWQRVRRKLEQLEQQHLLEKERTRIARDMHDDLGARLTEILLLGEWAKKSKANPGQVETQIDRICWAVRDISRNLNALIWAVNPRNDSVDNLADYFCKYAEQFLGSSSIRFRVDAPVDFPRAPVSSEVRHNLFLVVKEALNNVVKHSSASQVQLRFRTGALLSISIEDDGRGFQPPAVSECGNGLQNMAKRMREIGGTFELTSQPGGGARIRLEIPLDGGVSSN